MLVMILKLGWIRCVCLVNNWIVLFVGDNDGIIYVILLVMLIDLWLVVKMFNFG